MISVPIIEVMEFLQSQLDEIRNQGKQEGIKQTYERLINLLSTDKCDQE